MSDFIQGLEPEQAVLLAAAIGVVGVIVGAYLSKSVQARNLEADRKADVYAKVWGLLRRLFDSSQAATRLMLAAEASRAEFAQAQKETDVVNARIETIQAGAAGMSPEESTAAIAELGRLAETAKEHIAITTAIVERNDKERRKLKALRRETDDLQKRLTAVRPSFELTASRLVSYRHEQVTLRMANLYLSTTRDGFQTTSMAALQALNLWTTTVRRDTRATRRGGLRLVVFVLRSLWVRGLGILEVRREIRRLEVGDMQR
jgi:hypothetical protein